MLYLLFTSHKIMQPPLSLRLKMAASSVDVLLYKSVDVNIVST